MTNTNPSLIKYFLNITLYAPKYGIGIQPRCVHNAEQTKTYVFPDADRTTSDDLSNLVSSGNSFSVLISSFVNLLMNTGIPFQTIYITSPGGKSPTL